MSELTRRELIKTTLAITLTGIPGFAESHAGDVQDGKMFEEEESPGSFPLVRGGQSVSLFLDGADHAGVIRAARDLQADIERVTGIKPKLKTDGSPSGKFVVIAGTLGKSRLIDELVQAGKIDVRPIAGKWESFIVGVVENPLPGIAQALVVTGSDKRGTIYGLYELSQQIGVSPWYWWADVPAKRHREVWIKAGLLIQGPPAVKYRGIFINDEDPCLGGWSKEKYGGVNSKMYTHMFELLLRLRGNYLWPAMWGKSFNEDDPQDPRLADEYGIVMGTSHHEPMMRAQKEWGTHRKEYGNGEWNYITNEDGLKRFWSDGIHRNRNYENLVTIGMRGDGDKAMPDAGGFEANKNLLERIIRDQRTILQQELNRNPEEVPQLWALFTEVQNYYDAGMRVPDDVTLLFTDDNVGNVRKLPTAQERSRKGGAGIYFHMDMNGGPFSYKWLNSNPLPKVWEQMNLVHEYGANQIWIVNVGDLKPLEIPLEFFLRMAWDPKQVDKDKITDYQVRWAEREFGKAHAAAIADIVAKYAKYNGWRKPELVGPETFSLQHYREAERVEAAWTKVAARAEEINAQLPSVYKDAYYELVLHPVKACANLNQLYIAAARNALFTKQSRASANAEAARVRELFNKDQQLSDYYNHTLAGGKWDHMMDQTHIGYTSWRSPTKNIMPSVTELSIPNTNDIGIAIEGVDQAWPGAAEATMLPFDSINRQRSYIEVFARGSKTPEFRAAADQSWVILKEEPAPSTGKDRRVWVDIDWGRTPVGKNQAVITVQHGEDSISVKLDARKATSLEEQQARGCFGGLVGPIAFDAEAATRNQAVGNARWERIPDYGRGPSGMEIFPVTAATILPPAPAPYLEYPVFFAATGNYKLQLVTGPTLDAVEGRKLGIAVSLDDQPAIVNYVFTPETTKTETFLGHEFNINDRNNARVVIFPLQVHAPGRHVLKLMMVDPMVVVEKIIIHNRDLPYSYFGPPSMGLNV